MSEKSNSGSSSEHPVTSDNLYRLEEYKEVGNNMRHFSNMRIAVLTISLAINGVLLEKFATINDFHFKFSIFTLGLISTLVFLIFENRVTAYYLHYQSRAKELEKHLDFSQYLKQPPRVKVNATFVTRLLYSSFIVIWLLLLWKESY